MKVIRQIMKIIDWTWYNIVRRFLDPLVPPFLIVVGALVAAVPLALPDTLNLHWFTWAGITAGFATLGGNLVRLGINELWYRDAR